MTDLFIGAALSAVLMVVFFALGCMVVYWVRWVVAVLQSRGETAQAPEEFDTQPRDAFDQAVDAALQTCGTEAADVLLWEDELTADPKIVKYMRRMDRWSS